MRNCVSQASSKDFSMGGQHFSPLPSPRARADPATSFGVQPISKQLLDAGPKFSSFRFLFSFGKSGAPSLFAPLYCRMAHDDGGL